MENAILRLVQFEGNNHDGGLTGGGMDNAPQPKLPLTKYNLLRYVAFFSDYQLDNGNVLRTNDADNIFSIDYPPCPDGLKLHENPEIPNHDKVYSTNNNSSTEDSLLFSSSSDNEDDALSNDESDSKHSSYV